MSETGFEWNDGLEGELTDKQKAFLETAVENPDDSAAERAVVTRLVGVVRSLSPQ